MKGRSRKTGLFFLKNAASLIVAFQSVITHFPFYFHSAMGKKEWSLTPKRRLLFFFLANLALQAPAQPFVPFSDSRISYSGRVNTTDSSAEFYWTGTSVSLNVKGNAPVKAVLSTEGGVTYYYSLVDGKSEEAQKIRVAGGRQEYLVGDGLANGKHRIELFKLGNTDEAVTHFYGFRLGRGSEAVKAGKRPKRKIEFFGNSITCGHGVDLPQDSADSGAPQYFNAYWSYAAITARHFQADFHCTAKSGIGLTVSWFPQIMPEVYDRVNIYDTASRWDFSAYQPDIVVVNLFQNDSWLVNLPKHAEFIHRFSTTKPTEEFFVNAYASFVQKLRAVYPKARIICCLGNMDATRTGSKWPAYIDAAVASLHDKKVVTHFFPYKNTPKHPNRKEQQAMADDLIQFIETNNYWK